MTIVDFLDHEQHSRVVFASVHDTWTCIFSASMHATCTRVVSASMHDAWTSLLRQMLVPACLSLSTLRHGPSISR